MDKKKAHYIDTYTNASKTHQSAFMRELFKLALLKVENNIDGDKVEDWVLKIEKLWRKGI